MGGMVQQFGPLEVVIAAATNVGVLEGGGFFSRLRVSVTPTPVVAARAWRATRASAAVLGMSAFVALLLTALGLSLGTWIS